MGREYLKTQCIKGKRSLRKAESNRWKEKIDTFEGIRRKIRTITYTQAVAGQALGGKSCKRGWKEAGWFNWEIAPIEFRTSTSKGSSSLARIINRLK